MLVHWAAITVFYMSAIGFVCVFVCVSACMQMNYVCLVVCH